MGIYKFALNPSIQDTENKEADTDNDDTLDESEQLEAYRVIL